MDIKSLKAKQEDIQQRFDNNHQQAQNLEDEQKRLQGEYRLTDSLIKDLESVPDKDPATTIVAEPKEAKNAGSSPK